MTALSQIIADIKPTAYADRHENQPVPVSVAIAKDQFHTEPLYSVEQVEAMLAAPQGEAEPVAWHVVVKSWGEELLFTELDAAELIERLNYPATMAPLYRVPPDASAIIASLEQRVSDAERVIADKDARVKLLEDAMFRLSKLTPRRANARDARDLFLTVQAIAETALANGGIGPEQPWLNRSGVMEDNHDEE